MLASSTLQQDYGVHVGTVIHVPFEAPSQAADYNNPNTGYVDPHGPHLALQVVGIEASEVEFPSGTTPVYLLYAGPGFARSVLPHTAVQYEYFVRLRHGAAGIPQFDEQVNRLNLGMGNVGASSEDGTAATIQASIHPQAVGWWILAALAALVGLAVVGQALARQSAVESEDHPTLVAVGMSGRELFALDMARNLVVGVAGAVGAVVIATSLSPIAPLGEARLAEDSTGIAFDSFVLLLGALATVVVVLALGVWPALRAARTRRMDERAAPSRSSAVVRHLVTLGAPPTAVIGVRNALERRSGGSTVPLGSALLGMVLAVIALCATGVFGASLTHLTATPRLYGDPEQVSFSPPNPALLDQPGAQPGRHRHHRGCRRGGRHGQREDRRQHRRDVGQGAPPLLDGGRDIFRSATTRSGSASRPCTRWARASGRSWTSRSPPIPVPPTPSRTGSSPRSPSRSSGGS